MKTWILTFLILLLSGRVEAHILLTSPMPRRSSDSTKFTRPDPNNPNQVDNPNPCGGVPRTVSNLSLVAGQSLRFEWTETINHPGRFIIQFSPANDQGFWDSSNRLGLLEDTKAGGVSSMTVTVPNQPCESCTIRLLQVMDEQPGEYYVQCVDVRISAAGAATPGPGRGGEPSQSSGGGDNKSLPRMGGCGTISTTTPSGGRAQLILLLPLFILAFLSLRRSLILSKH